MDHKNYSYKSGDSIEVEILPGTWRPGIFQSYVAVYVDEDYYFNVIVDIYGDIYLSTMSPKQIRKLRSVKL